MYDGIINVYKEKGYTSHDVVAKMRGILKMKKIGHTGTLDPQAEGVLPVCIGKATKLVDLITDKEKTYEAVMRLGITTDTQDMTGTVIKSLKVNVGLEATREAVSGFIGGYDQLPPMYSAIKVNGKKLYELARQGKEVERKKRRVEIRDIKILHFDDQKHEATILVECGKGTYIRTLIHDIGIKLGCGASMKDLTRRAVGSFCLEDALYLSEIEKMAHDGRLEEHILPVDKVFEQYEKLTVGRDFDKLLHNGNVFYAKHLDAISAKQAQMPADEGKTEEWFRVYDSDDIFVGIYRYDGTEDCYRPVKMFL